MRVSEGEREEGEGEGEDERGRTISSLPYRSTILSLTPGVLPGRSRSKMASTNLQKTTCGLAPRSGRMAPLEPPSGMSLFLSACVDARPYTSSNRLRWLIE